MNPDICAVKYISALERRSKCIQSIVEELGDSSLCNFLESDVGKVNKESCLKAVFGKKVKCGDFGEPCCDEKCNSPDLFCDCIYRCDDGNWYSSFSAICGARC